MPRQRLPRLVGGQNSGRKTPDPIFLLKKSLREETSRLRPLRDLLFPMLSPFYRYQVPAGTDMGDPRHNHFQVFFEFKFSSDGLKIRYLQPKT
jgi:hypothetical protein